MPDLEIANWPTGVRRALVPKTRVQLDFTKGSVQRLNTLKQKTEASSYAEVVKHALQLYEALIEETEKGNTFCTLDKRGVVMPIKLWL